MWIYVCHIYLNAWLVGLKHQLCLGVYHTTRSTGFGNLILSRESSLALLKVFHARSSTSTLLPFTWKFCPQNFSSKGSLSYLPLVYIRRHPRTTKAGVIINENCMSCNYIISRLIQLPLLEGFYLLSDDETWRHVAQEDKSSLTIKNLVKYVVLLALSS